MDTGQPVQRADINNNT